MSNPAKPKQETVENGLIDRMNVFVLESRLPTPFESAALRRDVSKLKKNHCAAMHNLLGMLAALELDLDAARKHHRAAIRMSGNEAKYRNHFAVTLSKFFVFDEAISILEQSAKSDPADLSLIDLLISTSIAGGRFRFANKWVDIWSRRCPEKAHESSEYLKEQVIPYLDEENLDDDQVGSTFDRALKILVKNRKRLVDWHVRWPDGENEDEDSGLCLVVGLRESSEVVADLVSELCESEAELGPSGSLINKVSVSFNPIAA